jgi:hypothetical protein
MNSFKKIISVRTPSVLYDKQSESSLSTYKKSDNFQGLSIHTRSLLTPTKHLTIPISPHPQANSPNTLQKLKRKPRTHILIGRDNKKRNCISIDRHSNINTPMISQISLRYKLKNKSTEVKILRRKMQSNDALIVERIPTPSNLYLKEIQAFSLSRNRLHRNKKLKSIQFIKLNTDENSNQ